MEKTASEIQKTTSVIETLKKYYGLKDPNSTIYVDIESTDQNSLPTKPMYVTPSSQDLTKAFEAFFDETKMAEYVKTLPQPAVYDDMENINNNKIAERFPKFGFGDLLDEILEDFGGVQDIFSCEWDETRMEGEVVCLMNDWRVFRYFLKQNDLSILDREARIRLINKDCIVFEDIDDWSAWKELADVRIEHEKKEIKKKEEVDRSSVYGEKYSDALKDFFNGNLDAIQKIMSQNNNV